MDILKAATEWARAEVFSSTFFIFFGILFILGCIGFWQLGKTDIAKAFVWPTLVCGLLILTVGVGLFFTNKSRIQSFTKAYNADTPAFIESEIARTEGSMKEYQLIVFKIIPLIIVVCAVLIIFVDKPLWRAIATTTIAMMVVILLVDNNANGRIEAYHDQLISVSDKK